MTPNQRGHVVMTLSTALVATSFPVGAAITHGLDSGVLTLLRFTLAAVLFAPIVAWRYGLPWPSWRDLARYSLLSACLVGFFWGMFVALRHTTALNTATIFTLTPLITAVTAALLLGERQPRPARVALLLGAVGAVWVVFRGDLSALLALQFGRGDAIFLAGTVAMGVYGALVKLLHRGEPIARMTLWTLVTGAVWLLLLSLPRLGEVDWAAVPTSVYAGIVYLAVFTTIVTFFALQWSTSVIGPTKVMSYTFLNPVLVLLIGLLSGAALPPLATYPGFLLVLAATTVVQMSRTSGSTPAQPTATPSSRRAR